jgi:membrane associated rhomboid family serine protease
MSPRGQPAMGFGVPPLTRGVKWLGGATLALSVLAAILGDTGERLRIIVSFTPARFWHGWVWQPLTYTFLNLDPISLLFALLGLWLLGASLEQMWGTRRFVTFYFVTGAAGALVTGLIGFLLGPVWQNPYFGNWSSLEGLIAAFAVLMPNAQIFLYFVPVQARWMLPISAGITLLFMLMGSWVAYLPQLFGLGAGVLFAGGVAPRRVILRMKVWWIDRRLRRSKLRVVRGKDDEGGPFTGTGRGSDKYLH